MSNRLLGPEIEGKRLGLLRETLPGVSRVAYLGSKDDTDWESLTWLDDPADSAPASRDHPMSEN